ncbi:hypothetical protein OG470_36280 [Micromonospora sp. NBC_00389]|uniref:hypothetical protein n=1 Tax=Micromonospora sp. NBC_00389 TaxID=2903586 RepID=UPI002E1E3245
MRLIDLVERLDQLPDEATIYAGRPWTPEARAAAVVDDENQRSDYLLEVSLVREALEVWSAWRGGRSPDRWACVALPPPPVPGRRPHPPESAGAR